MHEQVLKKALIELMKRSSMHILQGVLIRRVYKRRVRGFFRWRGQVERLKEFKVKKDAAVGTRNAVEDDTRRGEGEKVRKKCRTTSRGE